MFVPAKGGLGGVSMKKDYRKLWTLFRSMFLLSACAFGGGFVIVSLMKKKYVEELKWLGEDEMLDVTAITQSAPGPILVNCSVIIGYRVSGIVGSLTAILGTILPPMAIISVISLFYAAFASNIYVALVLRGMQAGVAAVILDVVWSLGKGVAKQKSTLDRFIMAAAFAATFLFHVNVIYIILAAALAGVLRAMYQKRKGEQA